ncbi:MAG: hypothetical protein IE923_02945 [Micrococcales bacterium]|nr:hypothetical protein [Micrococcales bacterium]
MTTAHAPSPAPGAARRAPLWPARTGRRRGPALRTARNLLRWFAPIAGIYAAIVVVVVVAVPLVVASVGHVEMSVVWFARQSGIWFPFSVLIGVAAAYPPVHVANGMTRRSYVRGALGAVVVIAAGLSVGMTAALLAERTWYRAMGWDWGLVDGWFAPSEGLVAVFVSYLATYLVAHLSGLLVGTVYAVGGGWWGTLTLPLTVGPVLLVATLVGDGGDWRPFADVVGGEPGTGTPPLAVLAVATVLAVALAAAFSVLTRRRAIAPRRG